MTTLELNFLGIQMSFFKNLLKPADNHLLTSYLFLKLLALIYFVAFLSMAVQVTGLVGPNGILPFQNILDNFYQHQGTSAWWKMPTLFWFSSNNLALHTVTILGCAFSVLLFFGRWQRGSLITLFILYLSLYHAGQTFLNFQWDTLLLECGFLAIFLVSGASNLLIFLFHFLLFRLRFMSGVSKLASEDASWSNFTALNYYFETQPLPHVGSWYFHQLPEWMLRTGTGFTFFTELIIPFFIFLPRRFRLIAAGVTLFMQLLIIATSNHNFVNLLTIILCIFLLDDKIVGRFIPKKSSLAKIKPNNWRNTFFTAITAVLIISASLPLFYSMVSGNKVTPWLAKSGMLVRSYGLGHIYHIFPTMQVERHELQVEGSYDGVNWQAYTFRYKLGDLSARPKFIVPHQPRLDWMIWFVPPKSSSQMQWFTLFMRRLAEGSPQVLALLKDNPFKNKPPKHLRVLVYRYHFTNGEERKQTGNWWKKEYLGEFPYVAPRRP